MTLKAVEQRPESTTVGHGKRLSCAEKLIRKRRCRNKVKRPYVGPPSTLQKLFDSCKRVFKGPGTVPSPDDVKKLCHILDYMLPKDVGLSEKLDFFRAGGDIPENTRVITTTIYKCDNFSLSIFFLPAGGVIPLHNHPGMTVFSKLLLGEMHIKSYDWFDNLSKSSPPSQVRLAELKADRVFKAPCDTSVLYPTTGGNMHAFTAITPCAVLDVIGPPYSEKDGRDCSYYKDSPYSAFADRDDSSGVSPGRKCYAWLQKIDPPENSRMDGIEYMGPPIINDAYYYYTQRT